MGRSAPAHLPDCIWTVEAGADVNENSMLFVVVLIVGLPAIWIDTRQHRIPNKLVLATLAMGLGFQFWHQGPHGLLAALGGIAVGMLLFLPIHIVGAMGAGDVKFMGALGALLGPAGTAVAAVLTLLAGGTLALATLGWHRCTAALSTGATVTTARFAKDQPIPYAAAITTGSLAAVWWLNS
jgi:prepilin peptidase CpaA